MFSRFSVEVLLPIKNNLDGEFFRLFEGGIVIL
jgi:hypothetical protein